MCQHCEEPPCVDVCPTGASFKRADGIVLVDKHICIGCRYCMMACPYKARSFVHEELTDQKPDVPRGKGCGRRLHPVRAPRGSRRARRPASRPARKGGHKAMVFGDLNDPQSEITQRARERALTPAARRPERSITGVRYQGAVGMAHIHCRDHRRAQPAPSTPLLGAAGGARDPRRASARPCTWSTTGHYVTGMANQIVWGMPHVFAVFLIVAASGALNVASIASVFGRAALQAARAALGPARALAAGRRPGGAGARSGPARPPDRGHDALQLQVDLRLEHLPLHRLLRRRARLYLWTMMERRMNRYSKPAGMVAFIWRLSSPPVPARSSASWSRATPTTRRCWRRCSSSCPSPMGSRFSCWY